MIRRSAGVRPQSANEHRGHGAPNRIQWGPPRRGHLLLFGLIELARDSIRRGPYAKRLGSAHTAKKVSSRISPSSSKGHGDKHPKVEGYGLKGVD